MPITFINPFSGQPPADNLRTFDMSVLSNFYAAGGTLSDRVRAALVMNGPMGEFIKQKNSLDVVPPWLVKQPPKEDNTLRDKVFSDDKLINLKDPSFDRNGVSDTAKALFASYKALDRMRALIEYAGTKQGEAQISSLGKRFAGWTAEVRDFVNKTKFDKLTMMAGIQTASLKSTIARKAADPVDLALGRPIDNVFHGARIATVRTDPIPGLTGTETFTIAVTENGVTTNVTANLANAASTKIDDIATYLTGRLQSVAGITSYVKVERKNENSYNLEVVTSSGETFSFSSPSDATTSIYVTGRTGSGDFSNGFALKFEDLSAASPTQRFYNNIFTQKADIGRATAVDSNGYVYVLGTTKGSLDDQVATGATDVFLLKYDPAGRLVSTRMMGSARDINGFSLAIDSSNNVIVAGQVFGPLNTTSGSINKGTGDSFVTKFDSTGLELWTRQVAPYGTDGANSVTVDTSGNIYVAGFTYGQLASGQTSNGGKDAYVTKLNSSGTLVYNQQFGTAADESAAAVVVDGTGGIFLTGTSGSNAFLRKYTDGATPTLSYETNLGDIGSTGAITGMVRDSTGNYYIAGSTTNTALAGTVGQAHAGGLDGFVLKVTDNGASSTTQYVTYSGTTGTDRVHAIAYDTTNSKVYVTGETDSVFAGETNFPADVDGFVMRFSAATGAREMVEQFGGSSSHRGFGIAFDAAGASVLSHLGLPRGAMFPTDSRAVVSQTTVRPGQHFYVEVNGRSRTRISLDADDLFEGLANQINKALGTYGIAQVKKSGSVESLVITAKNGGDIQIRAGSDGFNALPGLGLKEMRLLATLPKSGDELADKKAKASRFALGLTDNMTLQTKKGREEAMIVINNALREIRKAYRYTVVGFEEDKPVIGPPSAADAAKIAKYKDALRRVQALVPQSGGGGLLG